MDADDADAGSATPVHSDFGDTDDEAMPDAEARDAAPGAAPPAAESSDDEDDEAADAVLGDYEAAADRPGAPRDAHLELIAALRSLKAARPSRRWPAAQGEAWARFRGRHALEASEWLQHAADVGGAAAYEVLDLACREQPRDATLWLGLVQASLEAGRGPAGARATE
mmetsp:Transcript_5863/g.17321  ORF Transcript_5863/g.17321 Transcript_5863/m.17321 type:complete len:168 (+) Transcript_5863:286-789(+)